MLPQWLQRRFDRLGAPFTYEVSGSPELNRDKNVRSTPQAARVMLREICSSGDRVDNCNSWLEHTFEQPARELVLGLAAGRTLLADAEVVAFARWATKTVLLYMHPSSTYEGSLFKDRTGWASFPPHWLTDLRQTGAFPADLSLWLALHDPQSEGVALPGDVVLALPGRTTRDDGGGGVPEAANLSLRLDDNRVLAFSLAFHPLCDVVHPFVDGMLALHLWPNPPESINFASRPVLGRQGFAQWQGLWSNNGTSFGVPDGCRLLVEPASTRDPLSAPSFRCGAGPGARVVRF
ncbi:hypothetical protein GCM10017581_068760 [Dactylosporangium matsuzakiense]|uniref:Uncharacterized protein n=1 Tax=Dactylosporangium matsuzakiense TaxID=53360 RepID=A0A9W6NQ39_9ACTN|nr:hypothetical protein GCM10017581_068760 [Dactylosporangium matsuzakiense]